MQVVCLPTSARTNTRLVLEARYSAALDVYMGFFLFSKVVPLPGPRDSQRENRMLSASRKDGRQKIKGSVENNLP